MIGDVQPFERHPELARWVAKIASIGNQFSWATWCAFLREINRALDAERERSQAIHVSGSGLLRALESYGFPVSDAAETADMSVEVGSHADAYEIAARKLREALGASDPVSFADIADDGPTAA